MSKPTATTLPWRTKLPERVRRIEIKSPVARPGFLFVLLEQEKPRSTGLPPLWTLQKRCSISAVDRGDAPVPAEHQGRPTTGRSRSVTPVTSVQMLLDRMKRRKFSMPRSFLCKGDV
jgi:hypothetical protein